MMTDDYDRTEVLITVMTYPHPSRGHRELVCTAGVTDYGEWVRLYPIDYRYRPRHQQFRKYQWIEVGLRPRGSGNDSRKESRQPDLESIRILGEPIDTRDGWAKRRAIIDAMPHHTRNQLQNLHATDRTSLGIIRPTRVLDLKYEPASPEWKPEWQALFSQLRLFGPAQKPLRKIPYKFSYVSECEDSQKPHSAMVEDWELGVLFLKEADRLGSDEAAAESVRAKFLDQLCAPTRDTRFFMGTVFPYNTWVVIGVFWPPRIEIPSSVTAQGTLPL
jgi:hypothetical protein